MKTVPQALLQYPHDKNPDKNPEPETPPPADTPADTGYLPSWLIPDNPLNPAYTLISKYPWILLILAVAAWWGMKKLWEKLSLNANISGRPLASFQMVRQRTLSILLKEDEFPVLQKPEKLAQKLQWLTWKKWFRILIAVTIIHLLTPSTAIITKIPLLDKPNFDTYLWLGTTALIAILWLGVANHVRKIVAYRHFVLMQMFEVANSAMKYDAGSELNPWGYIQISEWENLYTPGAVRIMYPPKYRAENQRNQEAFERGFAATTSDQHAWVFEWEPTNNCVTATPTPYIPTNAPYPFPDTHPWDEIPLGEAAGGETAIVKLSVFPHMLIAGTTGSGKLAKLNTRIPVPVSVRFPDGWATFGTIQKGDELFDEKGNVCRVVGLSDINEKPDLYEVEFSDGTVETVDGDHLWWTETRKARESKWNTRRKTVTRTPLLSNEKRDRLAGLVAVRGENAEVTIKEVADVIGVSDTTGWLRDLAAHVGPVGEIQVVTQFEYAEQEVVQKQKVRCFRAGEVWAALAKPGGKIPAWFAARGECAKRADLTDPSSLCDITVRKNIASVLGVPSSYVNRILSNFSPSVNHAGSPDKVSEATVWRELGEATCDAEQRWLTYRDECEKLAERYAGSDEWVTVHEVQSVTKTATLGESAKLAKHRGVTGEVQVRDVTLSVPEKTVERGFRFASTYLLGELARLVDEYGQNPVNDQRWRHTLGAVRTTSEIRETLRTEHGHANHAVPVAKAVDLPEQNLPIDPYLLGVWLGDGFSREGKFCGIDHQIAETLTGRGYTVCETTPTSNTVERHADFRNWKVEGLIQLLRENNLLQRTTKEGSRKHIPAEYLRASIRQRRDLLAGLLDTDGTVAPQGTVAFTNTNETLARQTRELAVSLGYRATIIEGRAILTLPDGSHKDYGPKWDVSWTCAESPFYLDRKTQTHQERNQGYTTDRNDWRYIVDVRPAPQEPGRCIMVDSPSRLFLVGDSFIPTHNSVTQRTILMHVLQSPMWRVGLIDPKRVELSQYASARNVMKIATELEESAELLEFVEQMMQKRYLQMKSEGVNHFTMLSTPPPAFLLMIDEAFALLAPENIKSEEGKERDALHARCTVLIGSLARLGRAAGIHLILATQRPDAKIIPGEVRANLDCRIAQGRMDSIPSMMVLDSDHATRISGEIKGRAVVRMGNDYTEFQAFFLPENMVEPVVEMSNALAAGEMTPEDFLGDDVDYLEEEDLSGAGGFVFRLLGPLKRFVPRMSLPRVPVPRKFQGWMENRKRTVADRNAELERLGSGLDVVDSAGFEDGRGFRGGDVDEALGEIEETRGGRGAGLRRMLPGRLGGRSSGGVDSEAEGVVWGDEPDVEESDGFAGDASGEEGDLREREDVERRRRHDRRRGGGEGYDRRRGGGNEFPPDDDDYSDVDRRDRRHVERRGRRRGGELDDDERYAVADEDSQFSIHDLGVGEDDEEEGDGGAAGYTADEIQKAREALEEMLSSEDFLEYDDGEEGTPFDGFAPTDEGDEEPVAEVSIGVDDLVLVPDEYFGTTMGDLLKTSAETGVPISAAALLSALSEDFGLPPAKKGPVSSSRGDTPSPAPAPPVDDSLPPWVVDTPSPAPAPPVDDSLPPIPGVTVFPSVSERQVDDIERQKRGESPSEMWQRLHSESAGESSPSPATPQRPGPQRPATPAAAPAPPTSPFGEGKSPFGEHFGQWTGEGPVGNELIPGWAAVVLENPPFREPNVSSSDDTAGGEFPENDEFMDMP